MKKILQIRASSNKLQLSSPNNSQLVRKQSQVNLPPINTLSAGESQKTLLVLLKNMQTYAELHPGNISRVINDCLGYIYKGFPEVCNQQQNLSMSSVLPIHKKVGNYNEIASATENSTSKSQLMNVKRAQLKKVESRKLFQKAKAANYQGVVIKRDKQALTNLKKQIGDITQQLSKATSRIKQLEKTLADNKKYAQQAVSTMITYQQNLKAENMTKKKQQQKIKNINEDLSMLKETFANDIKRSQQHIQSLKVVLQQRQNQIKALWILCHAQVKK